MSGPSPAPAARRRDWCSLLLGFVVRLAAGITVSTLIAILLYILVRGIPHLQPSLFALSYNSENVSLFPALVNTVTMTALTLAAAAPVGVLAAIYLSEYARRGSRLVKVLQLATETLSGIPSIVYGLFGMLFFGNTLGFSYSLLAGGMTLAIMVLPLILRTTEEALLSVPDSYREGSLALGAGKLRTVMKVVLPPASGGIFAGIILATGRIVGETAALIYTAGTVAKIALNPMSSGSTLAVHVYVLSGEGLHVGEAYATAVVLMVIVFLMNALSGWIAKRCNRNS